MLSTPLCALRTIVVATGRNVGEAERCGAGRLTVGAVRVLLSMICQRNSHLRAHIAIYEPDIYNVKKRLGTALMYLSADGFARRPLFS